GGCSRCYLSRRSERSSYPLSYTLRAGGLNSGAFDGGIGAGISLPAQPLAKHLLLGRGIVIDIASILRTIAARVLRICGLAPVARSLLPLLDVDQPFQTVLRHCLWCAILRRRHR